MEGEWIGNRDGCSCQPCSRLKNLLVTNPRIAVECCFGWPHTDKESQEAFEVVEFGSDTTMLDRGP